MRTTKKLALMAGTVMAVLIGMAIPAAADGPFNIEITGGTLDTELGQFDLAPDDLGPCEPVSDGLEFTTDGDATSGTWSVDGWYKGLFQLPGSGPTDPWYQATFTLSGSGSYTANPSPPPDYFLDGFLFASVEIHTINTGTCAKVDLLCTVLGGFVITSGEYTGTLPAAGVGDVAVIDAETQEPPPVGGGFGPLATGSPCEPPWSALNGTHAQLTDMTLQIIP